MIRVGFPQRLYVEPTNDCNLACVMCSRSVACAPVGYMTFDLFRRVIDEAAEQSPRTVSLHQTGEPLLHPRIVDMVAYAKRRGLPRVRFATNGTRLTADLGERLVAAGLDEITFSMDSLTAGRYCPSVFGREAPVELDAIITDFIAQRDRMGVARPEVRVRIILMPATADLVERFHQRWEGVADSVRVIPTFSWRGAVDVPGRSTTEEAAVPRLLCADVLQMGVVRWNGDVSYCHIDADQAGSCSTRLGNVAETSLTELLMGAPKRAVIADILAGRFELASGCSGCPDWVDVIDTTRSRTGLGGKA